MSDFLRLPFAFLRDFVRSRASIEAEVTLLRQQLAMLRRKSPIRPHFTSLDRLIFALLYRISTRVIDALHIVRPETVIR